MTYRNKFDLTFKVIEAAKNSIKEGCRAHRHLEWAEVYSSYAEPGYTDEEHPIVIANWNHDFDAYDAYEQKELMSRVINIFDKIGVSYEWCDEWTSCHECNSLVRTSPDCYSWTPSYVIWESTLVCINCLSDSAEDWLNSIEGDFETANKIADIHPEDHDYVKLSDGQTGFHPGQVSDPNKISRALYAAGFERYLFNIDSKGQFDVNWSVWLHNEEAERDDGMGIIEAKRSIEVLL